MNGTILFYDRLKGYGFIIPQGSSATGKPDDDVFFHHRQINMPGAKYLEKEQEVEYSLGTNPRNNRPWAEHVTPIVRTQPPNGETLDESVARELKNILGGK